MTGVPLRRVARTVSGAGFPHEHQGVEFGEYPFFKVGDFASPGNERYLTYCNNWVSATTARFLGARPVPAGSILLPKVGAALLGNARRICTTWSVFDNNVLAIIPTHIESRYIHYWLSTIDLGELANPGPVPSINEGPICELLMPEIGITMGKQIADYLDTETACLEALISKKQRMVSLMDEWFSASIGILLQKSGVEDVPVKRLVSKIGSGSTPRGGSEVYVEKEEGITFLRSQNVRKGLVDHTDIVYITHQADKDLLRTRLRKRDVLLNITGGSIGRTAVVSEEDLPANVSQHVCILRPLLDVDPYLLQASLETTSVQDQIDLCQVGGNREGLNFDQVGSLRVKIPRGDNGVGTRKRLDALRKRRDALVAVLTRQIELLQERRQALITAAVTGQLDIPEVVA